MFYKSSFCPLCDAAIVDTSLQISLVSILRE
uniref:Uncharacterized protein n=1 Tax=Arundo donax TaxID=35708 RepID=A0A0A9AHP2_ARUDO